MNLEKMNLNELSQKEQKNTNGGSLLLFAVICVVGVFLVGVAVGASDCVSEKKENA